MPSLTIGSRTLTWGERTYVMGILNITPDSFSGDGLLAPPSPPTADENRGRTERGVEQARRFLAAGADILDVGGESTRPGSRPVDAEEELRRVIPVIRAIAADLPDALISIDTCKAAVAEDALRAGAHILNDVWGLRADPELAAVAARLKAPVVLMHNRSKPANVEVRERLGKAYAAVEYNNLLEDVKRELMDSVGIARFAGIPDECILLDPGIGFGKTIQQNLELINRLDEIRLLGFPVLLGPSRKSFIGYTLDLPPDQRVEGTAAAVAVGITRGADVVRVHDVEVMVRVARMTDAIVRSGHSRFPDKTSNLVYHPGSRAGRDGAGEHA
jgi:dihydropteroate synthase